MSSSAAASARFSDSTEAPKPSQSEAELVAECAAQPLEREGERGRVQIAGAAHRRADQERAEPGLGRRIESPAGDVDPESDQRHAGLPVHQQIGAGKPGDPDAVLLRVDAPVPPAAAPAVGATPLRRRRAAR